MTQNQETNQANTAATRLTSSAEAYEKLRAAIQKNAAATDQLLEVIGGVVGLPEEYLESNLKTFRQDYHKKVEGIPEESRQLPGLRISCNIVEKVAFVANEPQFQAMFATLLASASDERVADSIHPGYADIINQLSALDLQVLSRICRLEYLNHFTIRDALEGTDELDISKSIDNLVRLGIVQWVTGSPNWQEGMDDPFSDANLDLHQVVRALSQLRNQMDAKSRLEFTQFGRSFVHLCIEMKFGPA